MWYMGNAALDRQVEALLTRAGQEGALLGAADVATLVNGINAENARANGRTNNLVEITAPQVHRSVRRIRLSRPDVPLVMIQQGRWSGYAITNDEDLNDDYSRGRFGSLRTALVIFKANESQRMDRLQQTDPARATRIRAHVDGLIRELATPV